MSVRRLDPNQPTRPFTFTPENLSWAKAAIAKYPPGKAASAVIPVLWRAQEQNAGWVSQRAMEYVADLLGMSYIRVYEVATFYTMFQLSPVGTKAHVQVCGTTPCMLRGAEALKEVCRRKIHGEPHHLNADGSLSWEEVECLGACVNAPMVQVWKDTYEDLTPEALEKLIDEWQAGRKPSPGPQNGRQKSMALTGATTLLDASLYSGQRKFTRVEAPPPPPPAAPPAAAAPPATAPAAPAAASTPAAATPVVPPPPSASPPPAVTAPPPPPPATGPVITAHVASVAKLAEDNKANPPAPKAPAIKPVKASPAAPANPASPGTYVEVLAKQIKAKKEAKQRKAVPESEADGAPEQLKKARGGKADDLKLIWGIGPALEKMLHAMGIFHFDQIGSWTAKELKWVDDRLEGFKGRAKRDKWIKQAKKLASGWRPDNSVGEKPGKK